jgi:hypothetical protein
MQREIRTEREAPKRRRVDGNEGVSGQRLPVKTSLLDYEAFAYRWINDDEVRLFQKTKQDDYDIMKNNGEVVNGANTDLGDAISVIVGTKPDGSARRAFLCRKPRKFYDDDQKKKAEDLDEQLARLRRGDSRTGEAQGDYVPSGGIRIA